MRRLDEISNGFQAAKVVLAAAELRLFDLLQSPGATVAEIGQRTGGSGRGLRILLDALVALELVNKDGERYRNHPEYESELLENSPGHYVAMLRHRNRMFRSWAQLEEVITGTVGPDRDILERRAPNKDFILAMSAVSGSRAVTLVDHLELDGVATVVDLGGGPGVYMEEIARRLPEARLFLADLPITLEVTRELLTQHKTAERIRLLPWNLYADPAPEELPALDLALLSNIVHGEAPERNAALFAKIFDCMAPGGRLIVAENLVDESRTSPRAAALFAVNMLAMTPGGRTYSEGEIQEWGLAAGFSAQPSVQIDERTTLVRLRKP